MHPNPLLRMTGLVLMLLLALPAMATSQDIDSSPVAAQGEAQDPAQQDAPPVVPPPLAPEEIEQVTEDAVRAEATQIAGQDAAHAQRLRAIFAALEDLQGLQVVVEAGIVVVSGTTPTRADADRALGMARALEGVLLVVDEVHVERSMGRRFRSSWDQAVNQLRAAIAYLPMLAAGAAILLLSWLLARLLRDVDFLYRLLSRRVLLQNLLRQSIFAAVLTGGFVATLRFIDAGALIGTVLGAAGVVGIAIGFAFRNIVENYLAGVLLAIRQPFSARDVVNIDGAEGTVLRMTTSETTLLDADGNHLRLPNAMVFNGKVLNYTRNPLRRFTVSVGVGTTVDLAGAQALGVETLGRMNGVVDDPAPSSRIAALGDSTVGLQFYGWVDQRAANYLKAASEALRLVKHAFDVAGIPMPAPAYQVQLENSPSSTSPRKATPGKPAAEPRPADSGPPPETVDVTAADDVKKQVEEEIERSGEENLLAEDDGR